MNKKTGTIITVVIVLASLVYLFSTIEFKGNSQKEQTKAPSSLQVDEKAPIPTSVSEGQAQVISYTKEAYDEAISGNKLVVLYFYANWCPICKAEFPTFEKAIATFSQDNLVAIRVNFKDSETDKDEQALAQEFGVPYQHYKVFLKNQETILTSPETWSEDRYIAEIGQALGR